MVASRDDDPDAVALHARNVERARFNGKEAARTTRIRDLLGGVVVGGVDAIYGEHDSTTNGDVQAAHAVLRRSASTWDDPADVTVALNGRLHLHRSARTAQLDGVDLDLTDTEQRILRALARRPAKVWSRGELLGLGDRGDGEERTVDVHVRNLRRKLDAARAGASDLVATVHGAGYRFNATALEDA
jgi:DNA-binding winged helix-turn-helix (wHTH) protein